MKYKNIDILTIHGVFANGVRKDSIKAKKLIENTRLAFYFKPYRNIIISLYFKG